MVEPSTIAMQIQKMPSANRTEWVVDKLTQFILSGEAPREQALPPERSLAEQFGVSRNVVREATKILQSRGLVDVRQGVGTIVQGLTVEPVQRVIAHALEGRVDPLLKLLEVRLTLEVQTAELAAQRRTAADIEAMETLLTAFEGLIPADGPQTDFIEACARIDVDFHQRVAKATQNEVFVLMLDSMSGLLLENRQRALSNSRLEVAAGHHRAIFAAIAKGDAVAAAREMRHHLETSRQETEAWMASLSRNH